MNNLAERTVADYCNALRGIGPLAAQWRNNPHRLVYDLGDKIKRLEARVKQLETQNRKLTDDLLAVSALALDQVDEEESAEAKGEDA